jgi:hypothetical protein
MVIHVKSEYGVDPYLEIPTPRSMEWRKKWFYLKNDDSTLLSAFTDGCPVPLASWGEGAARKDLGKIHPLREYLQQLRHELLNGTHLLRMCWRS